MAFGRYKDLLKSFGFQSFLWTQFLGAFNDNLFKIVLSMVAVNMEAGSMGDGGHVSLVGAIFILPFFLFSGYAGYFADVHNKRTVLIAAKFFEIIAVTTGLFAFLFGSFEVMLFTLFLMALHSTFFGPAKYGIVPEMLPDRELSRANGLLEMSTFLAIILGTSAGAIMFSAWKADLGIIGVFLIVISVIGTAWSFGIGRVEKSGADKAFKFNPFSEIAGGLRTLFKDRLLLFTVLGITYFWFLGALLQMDILLLGKVTLGLDDFWTGILITFLAIGIGAGSITAGRLSGDKIEPGLVPLGSIGMSVFAVLLAMSSDYPRACASLVMLGFFGGFFIVPLNALLQQKSPPTEKGRVIATNNFVNTAGILLASLVLWALKDKAGVAPERIILWFGLLTFLCTVVMMKSLPDFLVRFVLWMLTHTLYRIRISGEENVPFKGPALLVSNHVSYVDGFLIGACVQRFIRFMVYEYFYGLKVAGWLLRLMKAIPVADGNSRAIVKSIRKAREELQAGHVVCIFAEGAITRTGNILPFKKGFERIVEGLDVPVIPVHLDRVWGSVFSFKGGRFFWKWPGAFPRPITVSFGKPMRSTATAQEVRQAVTELGSVAFGHRTPHAEMLHLRFIKTAKRRWRGFCMADSTGRSLTWGRALVGSLLLSKWLLRNRPGEANIALLLPSTVAGALSNIACLMANKTPVNLNFTAGKDAMDSAVAQCGIKTVLTSRAFLSKSNIEKTDSMVFLEDIMAGISPLEKALAALSAFVLPHWAIRHLLHLKRCDHNDLAAIIFTTGSTGVPKGVMLTHRNIISNIEGFSEVFKLTKGDVVLGSLPFFHSFGFTGTIWFPLIRGFSAVYHPNPLDAKSIGELARRYRATVLIGTPTFYSSYVKKCSPEDFKTVRYAIAGAEKLKENISKEFRDKFGIELLEGYGCTELSPVISVNFPDIEYSGLRQKGFFPGTVGHPIPGVCAMVVDPETGSPAEPDKDGLLLVKGPNLMKGYLNQPDKTAQAFKDGWYVTGDIASITEEGFIRITDRVSRFSKIAGEMVPHIRIEEVLSEAFGCDCAVTAVADEDRGERIVAFYTADKTPAEVWERLCATGLPRLWIPKRDALFRVDSIPITATGKVDLKMVKALAMEMTGV